VVDDPHTAGVGRILFGEFEDPDWETWLHKSRQIFGSWGICTFVTSSLLAIPGFRCAAQSRKDSVSMELVRRVRYQLEHVQGSLAGKVEVERPHPSGGVKVRSVHGREQDSEFIALPEGSEQWRFEQLTLGVLDELTYNRHAKGSYASSLACVEGGGKLVVIATGCFGTFFNAEMEVMIHRAKEVATYTTEGVEAYGKANVLQTP
jgi:hypothetical protein